MKERKKKKRFGYGYIAFSTYLYGTWLNFSKPWDLTGNEENNSIHIHNIPVTVK